MNLNRVSLQISAGRVAQFPHDPLPQVALSGRSNVGKSSLVNTLLGRHSFARVSSTPGKTVTVNFYNIDGALLLVDLPGYGFARRSHEEQAVWSALTDGYFTENPNHDLLRLVIQLVDARIGITADDDMMLRYLHDADIPAAIVVTKTDKLTKTELANRMAELNAHISPDTSTPIVAFSSVTRAGRDTVLALIRHRCGLV